MHTQHPMKFLALILALFCFSQAPLQAQSKKEASARLTRDLEQYKHYSLHGQFDSVFIYTPDAMFDIIPRDSLINVMAKAMNNEYMEIQLTGFDLTGKPKVKKAGDYFWSFVPYDGSMALHLKGERAFQVLMSSSMKAKFGPENVKELGPGSLEVRMKNKKMIAFMHPADPHWYFVEDKRDEIGKEGELQDYIFKTIIPETVQKAVQKATRKK